MRRQISPEDLLHPENVMDNLINDYIEGALDDSRVFFRASVVAIDHVGGQFEDRPKNPKGSVKARVITNGFDAYTSDDDLPVFWPLMSHALPPVKEKEHVLVVFEDEKREHGFWVTRLPQPATSDSKNFSEGIKQYMDADPDLQRAAAEQKVQNLAREPTQVQVSSEFVVEDDVPFTARVGDYVLPGSNNAMVVIGRDRPGNRDSGQREGAGTVDIVVGRSTAEDMDMVNDKARVYTSALTDADANAGTTNIGQSAQPASAVIAIGDQIRIVARSGTKIVVTGGDMTLEAANINLGVPVQGQQLHNVTLGDTLNTWLGDLITALQGLKVNTANGPSVSLLPDTVVALNTLNTRIQQLISQTVKVKG